MASPSPGSIELDDFADDDAGSAASHSSNVPAVKEAQKSYEGRKGSGSFSAVSEVSTTTEASEVVFVKDNVSVHPTQNVSERINGRLRLLKQGSSLFMTWIPYSQRVAAKDGASPAFISGGNLSSSWRTSDRDRNLYTIRAVPVSEIRSIRRHTPPLGWQYIIVVLTSGLAFPPLYFHNGGIKEFMATLKEYVHVMRSAEDANLFLVNDISEDPLQRSLSSLQLRDVVPVTSITTLGGKEEVTTSNLLGTESSNVGVQSQEGKQAEEITAGISTSSEISERRQRRNRDPARDISINVLEKFSLVTRFARETSAQLFGDSRILGINGLEELNQVIKHGDKRATVAHHEQDLAISNLLDARSESQQQGAKDGNKPDGLASTNVGIFELVDGTQNESPTLVWGRARLPPLGSEEWATFLDSEGRVLDPKALRKRIFYGGIEHGLRREVWKFLLGYHKFDSVYHERQELFSRKYLEYEILKSQWQTVSEDQEKRFSKFRERKSRIEKDVVRTDRGLPFYAGDDNTNVTKLRDILITYSFFNFDLGYCQGMSDLLSPILFVMEEESESFWCFVALMERLAPNFHRDQNGMHSQLLALSKLVQLLDTPLHNYLKQRDCLNYFFCFRWVLIQFKREFEYENVMRLWEVLWTHHLSEHFHLYMCVALLKRYRKKIIDEQMDFDTLLKFINELSCHIDLDLTLKDAEALCVIAGDLGTACIPPGTPPALAVTESNGL